MPKGQGQNYLDLDEPVVLDILNYVQENDVIIDDPQNPELLKYTNYSARVSPETMDPMGFHN